MSLQKQVKEIWDQQKTSLAQRIPKVKFLEEAWMDYDQQEDIQVFRVWQRLPKTMSPEEAWKEAIHVQHML